MSILSTLSTAEAIGLGAVLLLNIIGLILAASPVEIRVWLYNQIWNFLQILGFRDIMLLVLLFGHGWFFVFREVKKAIQKDNSLPEPEEDPDLPFLAQVQDRERGPLHHTPSEVGMTPSSSSSASSAGFSPARAFRQTSVISEDRLQRSDLLQWDDLLKIVPKRESDFTFADKEYMKRHNWPPVLANFQSWRDYKAAAYHWLSVQLRLGFADTELFIVIKNNSLNNVPVKLMQVRQQLIAAGSPSAVLSFKAADEKLSHMVRTVCKLVEKDLSSVRRMSGVNPVHMAQRSEYFFTREQQLTGCVRTEHSKSETLLRALQLAAHTEQVLRLAVRNEFTVQRLIIELTSLDLVDHHAYSGETKLKLDDEARKKHALLETMIQTLDQDTQSSNIEDANGGTTTTTTTTKKGKAFLGAGNAGDISGDKDCKNKHGQLAAPCKYGVYCRGYLTGTCNAGHSRKDREILNKLKAAKDAGLTTGTPNANGSGGGQSSSGTGNTQTNAGGGRPSSGNNSKGGGKSKGKTGLRGNGSRQVQGQSHLTTGTDPEQEVEPTGGVEEVTDAESNGEPSG